MPIIGGVITGIKQALHQLVLFYMRDLTAQQNAFNAQVVRICLVDSLEEPGPQRTGIWRQRGTCCEIPFGPASRAAESRSSSLVGLAPVGSRATR